MKTKATALLIGSCLALLSNCVLAVEVRAMPSCGVWVTERSAKAPDFNQMASYQSRAWLLGYLSGVVSQTGKDALHGTDSQSMFIWMDQWCQANPLKPVADGADQLYLELVKQKHL